MAEFTQNPSRGRRSIPLEWTIGENPCRRKTSCSGSPCYKMDYVVASVVSTHNPQIVEWLQNYARITAKTHAMSERCYGYHIATALLIAEPANEKYPWFPSNLQRKTMLCFKRILSTLLWPYSCHGASQSSWKAHRSIHAALVYFTETLGRHPKLQKRAMGDRKWHVFVKFVLSIFF